LGRPQVSAKVTDHVLALREQGLGMLKIAKTAGGGVSTEQRILAEQAAARATAIAAATTLIQPGHLKKSW
jgi:hypothetical protein